MLLRRYKNRRETMAKAAGLNSAASSNKKPLGEMTAEELKAYAEEHGIDIGKATSQDGILKKIEEATE